MTTEKEVINDVLAVNGEAPVTSAESTNPSAVQARNAISRIDKKLQARGWWFNKEQRTLQVEVSTSNVLLPSNTLRVDPVDPASPYVQRGSRLYDRVNNTYTILVPVKVNIVIRLPIDECAETYAAYLASKARYEYYVDEDGDAAKTTELRRVLGDDYSYLHREDLAAKDVNFNTSIMGLRLRRERTSTRTILFDGD